jgi:hypothetical protein
MQWKGGGNKKWEYEWEQRSYQNEMNYDTGKGQPALYNDHSTNTVHIFLSATAGDGGTSTSEFHISILVCKNLFTSGKQDAGQTHNTNIVFQHPAALYKLKIKITFWYRLLCNSFILVSFFLRSTTCFDPFNWSSSGGYRFAESCYTNLLMSMPHTWPGAHRWEPATLNPLKTEFLHNFI